MAEATTDVQVTRVTLELTLQEANSLYAVTATVGGSPEESPRGHWDAIHLALRDALGYDYTSTPEYQLLKGGLDFSEYPEVSEEIRLTSETGGAKGSKMARFDQIPSGPLFELAEHYGAGNAKYPATENGLDNWRNGYEWSLSFAALQRHAWAFWNGEDIDAETGHKHVIAVAWHALALAYWMDSPELREKFDNRQDPRQNQEESLVEILHRALSDAPSEVENWSPSEDGYVSTFQGEAFIDHATGRVTPVECATQRRAVNADELNDAYVEVVE